MENYGSSKILENFGQVVSLQKDKKTSKKCPLCHFFATQEVVLGESSFGGENGLQIQKLKLFQKVNSPSFPMRYPAPDLDSGKPSKIGLEKSLRIG